MMIEDVNLFLRYAVPCGKVLVKRRTLSKERLEYLERCVIEGNEPVGNLEEDFKIGFRMLMLTALRMGKNTIDREVIRKYFWKDHKKCLEWRSQMMKDIEPDKCMVGAGKVVAVEGDNVIIEAKDDRRKVNRRFEPEVKEDDWVVTHYDYIVEKVTPEQASKVNE
jgi:hydrogenase maturation factor